MRSHKWWITGLLLLQLLLLVSLSFLFITYQVVFFTDLQQLTAGVQNIPVSEQPDAAQLLPQFLQLKERYDQLMSNLLQFLLWAFLIFFIGNGLLWSLAHRLVHGGRVGQYFWRFAVVTVMVILPVAIAGWFFAQRLLLYAELLANGASFFPYVVAVFSYLLLSAYTFLHTPLHHYLTTWWKGAIIKIYVLLPAIALPVALVGAVLYGAYTYAFTLPLLLAALLLVIIILVISKIYLITLARQVTE